MAVAVILACLPLVAFGRLWVRSCAEARAHQQAHAARWAERRAGLMDFVDRIELELTGMVDR
jgi:hypothetical protein